MHICRIVHTFIFCASLAFSQAAPQPAVHWNQIRGINFFTSTATNATTMWLHFDAGLADRELGFMERLGFNSVRLWLSEEAWRRDPDLFARNLSRAIELSAKHHLSVWLVLFDSCGIDPRKDAVEMTVAEAFQHFQNSPSLSSKEKDVMRKRYGVFAEGRGRSMVVPVGANTPFDIIFWQSWTPNPGLRRLGAQNWPEFDAYTDAVLRIAGKHQSVLAIDIMNEPSTLMDIPAGTTYREAKAQVVAFVAHVSEYIAHDYPTAVRTIGSSNLEDMKALASYQTVLSIHSYLLGDELVKALKAASDAARQMDKDVVLTEGIANTNNWLVAYGEEVLSTDEGQLSHYQKTLPIVMKSGMGWYVWGGIVGQMFTPSTDLIYPSGYLRPAALYLQEELARTPNH